MISDQAAAHSVGAHWQEKCECYVIMPTSTPAQFSEDEYRYTTGSSLEIPHDTGGRREFKTMSKIVKKSAVYTKCSFWSPPSWNSGLGLSFEPHDSLR